MINKKALADNIMGSFSNKDEIQKAHFSEEERKKLAESGEAMPDGSFPIRNESDLHNAIKLAHMGKNPGAAKAFIKKRAKELGLEHHIPKEWD
jgi:hypothetical protein